jgi:hypothetical protein
MDRETSEGISAVALPVVLAACEISFPLLGFLGWPERREPGVGGDPQLREQSTGKFSGKAGGFTKAEARADILAMIQAGEPLLHGNAFAERWQVQPSTVSRYLKAFRAEGFIGRKQIGLRKVVVARPQKSKPNGAVNGVAHSIA